MERKFYAQQTETTHELSSDDACPKHILMLEDEGELTQILQEHLRSNGFQVTSVTNGLDGLKKVMALDYDVIICDMLMPHLPGDKFYLAVQKVKPQLCQRFIFMTGHKGDRKIDEFIRSVHGMMMWKPFQPHELLEAIHAIIRRTRDNATSL